MTTKHPVQVTKSIYPDHPFSVQNTWIPYKSDIVTSIDFQLWHCCTKSRLVWSDIEQIKILLNDGANPFIRDIQGNYLTTVILFGFWWRTACTYRSRFHLCFKNQQTDNVWISQGCEHTRSKKVKIVINMDNTYKTYILMLLKQSMYEFSTKFYTKSHLHDSYWSVLVPNFNLYAKELLLINKALNVGKNICIYGIFPKDVVKIILGKNLYFFRLCLN
jgi:hypothetical protein